MELIKKLGTRLPKNCNSKRKLSYGLYLCPYCNKQVEKWLSNGKINKSCGCMRTELTKKQHGDSNSKSKYHSLYVNWRSMKNRCSNPNNKYYSNYGGRGISVCNKWFTYITFKKWALSHGWKKELQIDRRYNDGNYNPINCHFITCAKNNQNRSTTKLNWQKVRTIRKLWATGFYTQIAIAIKANVSQTHIRNIVNNKRWKE